MNGFPSQQQINNNNSFVLGTPAQSTQPLPQVQDQMAQRMLQMHQQQMEMQQQQMQHAQQMQQLQQTTIAMASRMYQHAAPAPYPNYSLAAPAPYPHHSMASQTPMSAMPSMPTYQNSAHYPHYAVAQQNVALPATMTHQNVAPPAPVTQLTLMPQQSSMNRFPPIASHMQSQPQMATQAMEMDVNNSSYKPPMDLDVNHVNNSAFKPQMDMLTDVFTMDVGDDDNTIARMANDVIGIVEVSSTSKPDDVYVDEIPGNDGKPVRFCFLCDVVFNSAIMEVSHCQGKKHKKKMTETCGQSIDAIRANSKYHRHGREALLANFGRCDICGVDYPTATQEQTHLKSKRHKKNVRLAQEGKTHEIEKHKPKRGYMKSYNKLAPSCRQSIEHGMRMKAKCCPLAVPLEDPYVEERNGVRGCTLCSVIFNSAIMEASHIQGNRHKEKASAWNGDPMDNPKREPLRVPPGYGAHKKNKARLDANQPVNERKRKKPKGYYNSYARLPTNFQVNVEYGMRVISKASRHGSSMPAEYYDEKELDQSLCDKELMNSYSHPVIAATHVGDETNENELVPLPEWTSEAAEQIKTAQMQSMSQGGSRRAHCVDQQRQHTSRTISTTSQAAPRHRRPYH